MNKLSIYFGIFWFCCFAAAIEKNDVLWSVIWGFNAIICIGGSFDNDRVGHREIKNDTERIAGRLERIESELKELKDRG